MTPSVEMGINRGYKELASAIIGRAVLDYLTAEDDKEGMAMKEDVKEFVYSDWFEELCHIRPEVVMERLESGRKGNYKLSLCAGWGTNR